MISRLCIVLLLFAFASGCRKISTRKLEGTSWKRVSMIPRGSSTELWQYPNKMRCELDNVEEFRKGGVYYRHDVGEICNPNNSGSFTWEVREGKIFIGSALYYVESFSKSEMVLSSGAYSRIAFQAAQ